MKILLFLIMFIITQNVFSDNSISIINKDELIRKSYMTNIILNIKYSTDSNEKIYSYTSASLEILSLYADNKAISGIYNDSYALNQVFISEFTSNDIVERTFRLQYRPESNAWYFFLIPRGIYGNLKSYYIPWTTRELKICYRIVFPEGKFSEQNEAILKIRDYRIIRNWLRLLSMLILPLVIIVFFVIKVTAKRSVNLIKTS